MQKLTGHVSSRAHRLQFVIDLRDECLLGAWLTILLEEQDRIPRKAPASVDERLSVICFYESGTLPPDPGTRHRL